MEMEASIKSVIPILLLVSICSCNSGPKVISADSEKESSETSSGIFDQNASSSSSKSSSNEQPFSEDLHTVIINEVLPASRYVYLLVTEKGNQFWIATRKQEVVIGETYFYRGGLLKTNFESKEHNRVFERIYLVNSLVAQAHGNNTATLKTATASTETNLNNSESSSNSSPIEIEGSIKIAEIVGNPQKYEGKSVQLSGRCVKVNPNIMGRNWIHLKDGSNDEYDLVVTSNTFVPEGTLVTFTAVVGLNKDFGAGYKYDLILENGVIVP